MAGVAGIQVAGGLVGEQQGRGGRQRPGQRHALLLAAGELVRIVPRARRQPHPVQPGAGLVHGAGPAGGQLAQAMGRSKASLSTKIHLAADALGYPLGFSLTGANVSDFDQAKPLLRSHLRPGASAIMDKGYDSDAIRAYVNQLGGVAVIALHPNRAQQPPFDEHLYYERHRIENLFARLKALRRIATRYEKLHATFAAMLALACILVWLKL